MQHGRERFVEMVKRRPPFFVSFGPAESNRVIFECLPAHEQQIVIRLLDAGTNFDAEKTRRCLNERKGVASAASNAAACPGLMLSMADSTITPVQP